MKDRIAKIIKEEDLTAAKFADEIGVQASSVSHILSGRNNPSLDFLIKIVDRFRGINPEWLLTGKGNMYKSSIPERSYTETQDKNLQPNLFNSIPADTSQNVEKIFQPEQINNNKVVNENENIIATEEPVIEESRKPNISLGSKNIEKIIIFFKDKSFDIYMPNE